MKVLLIPKIFALLSSGGTATDRNWQARGVSRLLVSSIYKAGRVGYLYRRYGWKDTMRRIREEVAANARPETA